MPRDPKPWYRKDRDAWFVTINGRRFNLGPDREAAHERFHALMLNSGDERELDGISVFSLFDEFLEWPQAQRSQRTYEWYSDFLQAFCKTLKVDRPADKLKPYDVLRWVSRHPNWSSTYQNNAIRSVQRPYRWAPHIEVRRKSGAGQTACGSVRPRRARRSLGRQGTADGSKSWIFKEQGARVWRRSLYTIVDT